MNKISTMPDTMNYAMSDWFGSVYLRFLRSLGFDEPTIKFLLQLAAHECTRYVARF